jgi:pimeloyl-ACP methyl ester carboxylesterase
VVVVGSSLGGLSAVLAAAHPELSRPATIAGVVSVSAPTRQGVDRPGTARLHWLCTSRTGRVVLRRLLRTRARRGWWDVEDISCELPGGTAGFTIVVQDPADRYFGPDHAGLLFALAPDPKALWWMVDSGHGTDLLTPAFAARLEADLRTRFTAPAAPT